MATLTFRDLQFSKQKEVTRISLYSIYYCEIPNNELESIGKFSTDTNSITFYNISEQKASRRFNLILEKNFKNLKNKIGNKPTYYIHRNSGIPLIGTNYFGLIDRDTNVIEVKPLTGCNFSCIYCSVDEGPLSRRKTDYVVEEEYLFEEFKKLVKIKGIKKIDAHINSQGEPTLYAQMVKLVRDIASVPEVTNISIDTNGSLLTKKYVDDLADAGLTRFNFSLNAMDPKIAEKMAGTKINFQKIIDIARCIPKKTDIVIVPLWLPGINDEELPKLARFAVDIGAGKKCPPISIQNFLEYQFGRNPVKTAAFDTFYKKIRELEEKNNVKLVYEQGFGIFPCKTLKKPFKRGQIIDAKTILPGRFPGEKLAVAHNRLISVFHCYKDGNIRVKVKRTKHNVFTGELI